MRSNQRLVKCVDRCQNVGCSHRPRSKGSSQLSHRNIGWVFPEGGAPRGAPRGARTSISRAWTRKRARKARIWEIRSCSSSGIDFTPGDDKCPNPWFGGLSVDNIETCWEHRDTSKHLAMPGQPRTRPCVDMKFVMCMPSGTSFEHNLEKRCRKQTGSTENIHQTSSRTWCIAPAKEL